MNKRSLEPLVCSDLIVWRWQSVLFQNFFSRRNKWWAVICRVLLPKDQRWMVNTHAAQNAKGEWWTPMQLKRPKVNGEHPCSSKGQRWMVNTREVQKAKGEWWTPVKFKRPKVNGEHREVQKAKGEWWTPVKLKMPNVHGWHPWSSKGQMYTVNTREAQKAKCTRLTLVKLKRPNVHG